LTAGANVGERDALRWYVSKEPTSVPFSMSRATTRRCAMLGAPRAGIRRRAWSSRRKRSTSSPGSVRSDTYRFSIRSGPRSSSGVEGARRYGGAPSACRRWSRNGHRRFPALAAVCGANRPVSGRDVAARSPPIAPGLSTGCGPGVSCYGLSPSTSRATRSAASCCIAGIDREDVSRACAASRDPSGNWIGLFESHLTRRSRTGSDGPPPPRRVTAAVLLLPAVTRAYTPHCDGR